MLVRSAAAPGGWESDFTETANSEGIRYTYDVSDDVSVEVEALQWQHGEDTRCEVLVMTAERRDRVHKNVFEPVTCEDMAEATSVAEGLMHHITEIVDEDGSEQMTGDAGLVERMATVVDETKKSRRSRRRVEPAV
ncbi:hypothetical protein [Haloarchaeobius sp. DFWS5]|uniref:hypothetical protein n=1 Tax=Haloarchaeobius sp. DFWS5 TaxID=3446114 RepID=UPI003EBF2BCD